VADGKKSLNQLIQLAMSVHYNQDLTNRREKDKRHHDLIAALRQGLTQLGPASWTCYHGGQEGTSAEDAQKRDSMGDSPAPNWDPALSARVTTGGLSARLSRWKARSHLLWIDGSWPPTHAPVLGINVEDPRGSHDGRKTKGHFPARQWSLFLCLTFLSQSPIQWQGYRSGQIWPAPRALFYQASGLLLGRPPLLSLFSHSPWDTSAPAGTGFTIY
jgi:hypothetical protein